MEPEPAALPDREAIERVLTCEPLLRKPADQLFEWEPPRQRDDGVFTMPYVRYAPAFLDFLSALAEEGFVVPFDWPAWAEEGMAIQRDPAKLGAADLTTVVRLFTLHVRADRSTEGLVTAPERFRVAAPLPSAPVAGQNR